MAEKAAEAFHPHAVDARCAPLPFFRCSCGPCRTSEATLLKRLMTKRRKKKRAKAVAAYCAELQKFIEITKRELGKKKRRGNKETTTTKTFNKIIKKRTLWPNWQMSKQINVFSLLRSLIGTMEKDTERKIIRYRSWTE